MRSGRTLVALYDLGDLRDPHRGQAPPRPGAPRPRTPGADELLRFGLRNRTATLMKSPNFTSGNELWGAAERKSQSWGPELSEHCLPIPLPSLKMSML